MTQPAASFRDPAGSCCQIDGRILRLLDAVTAAGYEAFLETASARGLAQAGKLVSTRRLPGSEAAALRPLPQLQAALARLASRYAGQCLPPTVYFEHERIWFPSYPYEWPPEMLWEAGRLTLELARASLSDSYGLKDATPYNVLYRGTEPVFIDVSSFKPREPGDPVWRAYGQFVRTFLLPLLVNQHWGIPLGDIFRSRRDGLLPQEVYRLCGPLERLKPPMLWLVSLPTWLAGKARAQGERLYGSRTLRDTRKARFILESLLARLERTLNRLKPASHTDSAWSDYMATHSYEAAAFAAKERFIEEGLEQFKPRRVLDVGANTGHFSLRAAKAGAEVVAIDADPACVGAIWRQARELPRNLSGNILPLVVDVSRPPPALGWRNRECASFLGRAAGTFDCVMLLAVIHHLLINERVPLDEILGLAAELTSQFLAVEFIAPEDQMFRELARGREDLHIELTQAAFEAACGEHFEIVRSLALPGTQRRLYWLRKKGVRSPGPGVGREAAGRTNGR